MHGHICGVVVFVVPRSLLFVFVLCCVAVTFVCLSLFVLCRGHICLFLSVLFYHAQVVRAYVVPRSHMFVFDLILCVLCRGHICLLDIVCVVLRSHLFVCVCLYCFVMCRSQLCWCCFVVCTVILNSLVPCADTCVRVCLCCVAVTFVCLNLFVLCRDHNCLFEFVCVVCIVSQSHSFVFVSAVTFVLCLFVMCRAHICLSLFVLRCGHIYLFELGGVVLRSQLFVWVLFVLLHTCLCLFICIVWSCRSHLCLCFVLRRGHYCLSVFTCFVHGNICLFVL